MVSVLSCWWELCEWGGGTEVGVGARDVVLCCEVKLPAGSEVVS